MRDASVTQKMRYHATIHHGRRGHGDRSFGRVIQPAPASRSRDDAVRFDCFDRDASRRRKKEL